MTTRPSVPLPIRSTYSWGRTASCRRSNTRRSFARATCPTMCLRSRSLLFPTTRSAIPCPYLPPKPTFTPLCSVPAVSPHASDTSSSRPALWTNTLVCVWQRVSEPARHSDAPPQHLCDTDLVMSPLSCCSLPPSFSPSLLPSLSPVACYSDTTSTASTTCLDCLATGTRTF
jgi:hypothetical protein